MSVNEYTNLDQSDVVGALKDQAAQFNTNQAVTTDKVALVANAAGVTLTAAQLLGGVIMRSGAAGVSDTTPTAALIIAAIPHAAVGTAFDFTINNTNSGTLTLVAGTGVTLAGTTDIATLKARRYAGVVTNITAGTLAVTIYGVLLGDV